MNNIDILEEKEKEAIKDLEEYLHWEELQGFSMLPRDKHIETILNLVSTLIAENKELKENSISKSKVQGLIDEINKAYENSKDEYGESEYYYPDYTIEKLQSLLGKE